MVTVFWGDNPLFDFYSHETPSPVLPVTNAFMGGSNPLWCKKPSQSDKKVYRLLTNQM
jgi:hypothetical protein